MNGIGQLGHESAAVRRTRAHQLGVAQLMELAFGVHGKELVFTTPLLAARLLLTRDYSLRSQAIQGRKCDRSAIGGPRGEAEILMFGVRQTVRVGTIGAH